MERFVVLEGTIVNEKTLAMSLSTVIQKIFDSGKIINLVTKEDILFSSSSAAADFILG